MGYELEDLRIYALAEELANAVWDLVDGWSYFAKDTVGKQFVRAADSIGANIAEGYGRHHPGEDLLFLYYARGSLKEVGFWLRRASKRALIKEAESGRLRDLVDSLTPQLHAYIATRRGRMKK